MPNLSLAGHPLHPQIVGLPIGSLMLAGVADAANLIRPRRSLETVATAGLAFGLISALAAAVAGAADYLSIPAGTSEKKVANLHAALNLSLVTATGINLALRHRAPRAAAAMSVLGIGGLIVSQWYGGHLVYAQGMRVADQDERGLDVAHSDTISRPLEKLAQHMTSRGPELHP